MNKNRFEVMEDHLDTAINVLTRNGYYITADYFKKIKSKLENL